jgi:hypothetical protein
VQCLAGTPSPAIMTRHVLAGVVLVLGLAAGASAWAPAPTPPPALPMSPFTQPALAFAFNATEPSIDGETNLIHWTRYVSPLKSASCLNELLPAAAAAAAAVVQGDPVISHD